MSKAKAFTLIELLIVLGIILILAALLFPVFVSAINASRKTACQARQRQAYLGFMLYLEDYDDIVVPVNYQPDSGNSKTDRTWVQLLMPYTGAFSLFQDPADNTRRFDIESSFDQDLVPGDTLSKYYTASMRANLGYNYLYLTPIIRQNDKWQVEPKMLSTMGEYGRGLLFVDTVHSLTPGGSPQGGGSYLAIPPCRFETQGSDLVDTFSGEDAQNAPQVLAPSNGWSSSVGSAYVYGGAWPWHGDTLVVVRLDGSIGSLKPKQLSNGCDAQDHWTGYIQQPFAYPWRSQ